MTKMTSENCFERFQHLCTRFFYFGENHPLAQADHNAKAVAFSPV